MTTFDETAEAILLLATIESDCKTDWRVTAKVLAHIRDLEKLDYPAPKVWAHGPKSVVLEWGEKRTTVSLDYLTDHYTSRTPQSTGNES